MGLYMGVINLIFVLCGYILILTVYLPFSSALHSPNYVCCAPFSGGLINGSNVITPPTACSPQAWTTVVTDVIQHMGWENVFLLLDTSVRSSDRQRLMAALSDHLVSSTPVLSAELVSCRPAQLPDKDVLQGLRLMALSDVRTALICVSARTFSAVVKELTHGDHPFANARWLVACPNVKRINLQPFLKHRIQVAFVSPAVRNYTTTATATASPMTSSQALLPISAADEEFQIEGCGGATGVPSVRAKWTSSGGLDVYTDAIFDSGLSRFFFTPMRVGVAEAVPFLKRLTPVGGKPNYEGMCIDMLQEMATRLKFKYELVEPPDGSYGSPEANGSWNGMVGMLARGDLDLAIGPFSITSMREEVIDFTVPFMQDGGGILTKGGEPGPDILTVFNPLPVAMWLSLGGAVLVTGVVLYVSTLVVGKRGMESSYIEGELSGIHAPWSVWESLFIVFGSLVKQSAGRHPVSLSGRLVLGIWWLFTILIISIYTASLAGQLTVRVHEKRVDSIQDLAESSIQPVILQGTSWLTEFMNETADVFLTIRRRLKVLDDNQQAVELVREGRVAYIQDNSAVEFYYRQSCRSLYMAQHEFSLTGLGLAVPKGAEYKDAINSVILKLQESGVLNVWRRHWWQATSVCSDHSTSSSGMYSFTANRQLEVVSIGALLGLYGAVVLLSSSLFLLRLLWCHCCRHSCRRRTLFVSREQQSCGTLNH